LILLESILDDLVKSPVFVIARSSVNAVRQSNPVFSSTYKNEIASSALGGLAMTLLPTFYEIIRLGAPNILFGIQPTPAPLFP